MSEDKTYTCAKCGAALTDFNRMVCDGKDCTASLCVDCAMEVEERVYCPICAGEESAGENSA